MSNYVLALTDTDGIALCKPGGSFFSKEERKLFLENLNAQFPEQINFADDGYIPKFIVLKSKNYIMEDEQGKVTLKGSSLKSATLEPIFKQFLRDIIDSLLNDREDFVDLYHKYVHMASNITDIKPWCSKKTISEKVLNADGATQVKMREAIEESDLVEGDRCYVYFKSDDSLDLAENFTGDYHKKRMYEKLWKITGRFWTIMDENLFLNYKLKRNSKVLEELLK